MILINATFLQLLFLYPASFLFYKKDFFITYSKLPNIYFRFLVFLFNIFSFNRFVLKPIDVFRAEVNNISDQKSLNSINEYFKTYFNKERNGGQIYIESILRFFLWEKVVIEEIFKNVYINDENYKSKSFENLYRRLTYIRNIETKIGCRLIVFKATYNYILFLLFKLIKFKLKKSNKISFQTNKKISSIILANIQENHAYQNPQILIKAADDLAKEFGIKTILNEKEFLEYLLLSISDRINWKHFLKLFYKLIFVKLKLFQTRNFLQDAANSIHGSIEIIFASRYIFNDDFKIIVIDPLEGKTVPFLSEIIRKGFEVFFISFSIGHFYTKYGYDYNGSFSTILSTHPGFKEIALKSDFKGKIIDTKCFLTEANKKYFKKIIKSKIIKNNIKIIIPETQPMWFFQYSLIESKNFANDLYNLSLNSKIEIFIKKKKSLSHLESYLNYKHPSHKIKFHQPIRGSMVEFREMDFILSYGISSIAIRSSEFLNIPYVIYDNSGISFNQWKLFYSKTKLKPIFAKNLDDLKQTFLFDL